MGCSERTLVALIKGQSEHLVLCTCIWSARGRADGSVAVWRAGGWVRIWVERGFLCGHCPFGVQVRLGYYREEERQRARLPITVKEASNLSVGGSMGPAYVVD